MSGKTVKGTKNNKRRLARNNYLLSKPAYFGDKNIPMTIELIQYDARQLNVKNIPLQSAFKDYIDKTKVNWFKVTGISDAAVVNRICREAGLHGFDVKDLLADQQVVKAVVYDKVTYMLMSSFHQVGDTANIDDMQIAFILGADYIISFQEELVPVFDDVKKEIEEDNILIRQKAGDFLLYILLNAVNLSNINTVMIMEDHLANMEESLITDNKSADTLRLLHTCRVNYMHIKRSVVSMREEFSNLLHNSNELILKENLVYFEDFDDRMRTTLGDLASFYETLTSVSDLYYNNNNMRMNEIIKRLTIVSTIFIPLTFMVGVWGMNFKFMPELDWEYGYIGSWAVLVLVAILSYLWIRKQKWF
ncbi:magnesium transporter [Dysgonomonas sp. PFB1-18]|uniref:CorA family divalent cation transporter n=1 Tax=unclassified Dysgonomonas TaxID=2630389 RepID=UPI002476B91E|nr:MULTISPECIES: CorA family divalent cation transporter [unclassified Dysgonomonas]MDH6307559.1 magnesium transporter [Dysgonomonas sp. PF1-14]MDH6337477.1 magnesium transporter [Dysgonomonas sp. PF1-16]MDH6378702.1 magnesium transporter [Dysgonomonas sp. PFB1-18]MDH6399120.1 magnesium transporter [Dysgonomonas sp. PF1-23]